MPPYQFIPFDPFLAGGMYCSAPHGRPVLTLMPRCNGSVPAARVSSLTLSSGWTPEACCSWTSQALPRFSRGLQDCLDGNREALLHVARGCSCTSQDPARLTSARGASMEAVSSFPMV